MLSHEGSSALSVGVIQNGATNRFEIEHDRTGRMVEGLEDEMIIIGCDPGWSGAFSIWNNGTMTTIKMGENVNEVRDQLISIRDMSGDDKRCFLEQVHSMPFQSSQSGFTFGENYGMIQMALMFCNIQIIDVTPQKWMKALSVGKRKEHATGTLWKKHLMACGRRLYPRVEFTLQESDAVLLMHYGMHHHSVSDAKI